ncbi:HEC/Ndc80p family-domain-containing protein [Auriculariales sp. MPI-PUGE-AT-0066]|nr:HEC/Ndc80p family-domain-containing protein [Auriculariales sp. MPI-PUGE-AT-0066]
MSQQQGDRRRSVLGPTRTQLPMPSSAMKKPPVTGSLNGGLPGAKSSLRQSLGGPPQRILAQPPAPVPPSTNPRLSVARPGNVMTSVSKRGAPTGKDQRDLRGAQFKSATLHAVVDFLQSVEYQGELSIKVLSSPPAREVAAVVKGLYAWLDPDYVWGRAGMRFEDECLALLKKLRYPYADSLTKATLQTPGSMPNMPHILGILQWLVCACHNHRQFLDSGDETLLDPEDVPEDFDDEDHAQVLVFEYFASAYDQFLSGRDQFEEEDRGLEDRYERRDRAVVQQNAEMHDSIDRLEHEYNKLLSEEAPKIRMSGMRDNLSRDILKLKNTLTKEAEKTARYERDVDEVDKRIKLEEEEAELMKQERADLEVRVQQQEISADEAQRMEREREQLNRQVDELKIKVEQSKRGYEDLEVKWANRGDRLEAAADEFGVMFNSFDIQPLLSPIHQNVDFNLTIDLAKEPMLHGSDINTQIKPAVQSAGQAARKQRRQVDEEQIQVEHELNRLATRIDQLEEELTGHESKCAATLSEADEIREAAQGQISAADSEAVRLEREISSARASAKSHGIAVKTKLQALEIEKQEQTEKIERLREETIKSIVRNVGEMAAFKNTASDMVESILVASQSR